MCVEIIQHTKYEQEKKRICDLQLLIETIRNKNQNMFGKKKGTQISTLLIQRTQMSQINSHISVFVVFYFSMEMQCAKKKRGRKYEQIDSLFMTYQIRR